MPKPSLAVATKRTVVPVKGAPAPKTVAAAPAPAKAAKAPKAPPVTAAVAENTKPARVAKAQGVPAAAPAPAAERGPRAAPLNPASRIFLLVKECPKRAGTKAAQMWAAYKNGMTVADARGAGISMGDIHWNIAHGFIELRG